MKYRWIRKQTSTYKDRVYVSYAVCIKNKHLYCSSVLEYCEDFVLRFAEKHGINYEDTLRNGKHKRIKL